MKEVIITLLVAVLLVVFFKNSKYTKDDPIVITVTDTLYKHDTTVKHTKGKDIPFVVLDTVYKIDEVHDTVKMIEDYISFKVYKDSFNIDSSRFVITDTISRNSIIGRKFNAQIATKTVIIDHTIVRSPRNEYFMGIIGDLRRFDNKIGLGVGLGVKVPKTGLFTLSATTNQYSLGFYKNF